MPVGFVNLQRNILETLRESPTDPARRGGGAKEPGSLKKKSLRAYRASRLQYFLETRRVWLHIKDIAILKGEK